jgi:hypothetical protein
MRLYQKSILSNCYLILVRAPTTKAVGSIDVTKLEPTALQSSDYYKIEVAQTFDTAIEGWSPVWDYSLMNFFRITSPCDSQRNR